LLYEEALDAYQKANFFKAVELAESLEKQQPDDMAVKRLLGRATEQNVRGGFREQSAEDLAAWTGVEKMLDK